MTREEAIDTLKNGLWCSHDERGCADGDGEIE